MGIFKIRNMILIKLSSLTTFQTAYRQGGSKKLIFLSQHQLNIYQETHIIFLERGSTCFCENHIHFRKMKRAVTAGLWNCFLPEKWRSCENYCDRKTVFTLDRKTLIISIISSWKVCKLGYNHVAKPSRQNKQHFSAVFLSTIGKGSPVSFSHSRDEGGSSNLVEI